MIKRITQRLNRASHGSSRCPRHPTAKRRNGTYFLRYVPHLPAGGEIVPFDRSWYNRAAVMGFATEEQVERFLHDVPEFERMLVRSGIRLIKRFSITDQEQQMHFLMRIHDPLKQWKLSPTDLPSRARWEAYTPRAPELHRSFAEQDTLRGRDALGGFAPGTYLCIKGRSVDPAVVHRRRLSLPREICVVSPDGD